MESFVYVRIDIFIVPVLTMAIIVFKDKRKLEPKFFTLIQYCVVITLNIPLTLLIVFFANILLVTEIEVGSLYYTVCAIISAVLLSMMIEIFRKSIRDRKE